MTNPSERELEQRIEDMISDPLQGKFVDQVVAVLRAGRDSVEAAPPSDIDDHGDLVIQVSDAAGIPASDAWDAVDAAGADPEPIADFTNAQT